MSIVTVVIAIVLFLTLLLGGTSAFTGDPVVSTVEVPTVEVSPPHLVPASGWEPVEIDDIDGVIVPEADADQFFANREAYWTPTVSDVRAAEAALRADQGPLDQNRQYAGYVEAGKPKILINGFCDALAINWYAVPVIVLDGGDCFFQGVYDVESDSIESFFFNGEA